jgi:hypothetical protein
MLYIGERLMRATFREHRRVIIGNHSVSDMKIEAIYPISGSNYSRKRHEMRLISKLIYTLSYIKVLQYHKK